MNLKNLYDAVLEAEAKKLAIQSAMLEALDDGTEEGKQKALDLRQDLESAKQAADEANLLYISARDADASEGSSAAHRFVPVDGASEAVGKTITRKQFEAMSAAERMSFAKTVGNSIVAD